MTAELWDAVEDVRRRLRLVEVAVGVIAANLGLNVVQLLLGGG